MKAPYKPEPYYCCKYCDDMTWPANDLYWSKKDGDWVCPNCFYDYEDADVALGIRLDVYLAEQEQSTITSILDRAATRQPDA